MVEINRTHTNHLELEKPVVVESRTVVLGDQKGRNRWEKHRSSGAGKDLSWDQQILFLVVHGDEIDVEIVMDEGNTNHSELAKTVVMRSTNTVLGVQWG